MPQNNNYKQDFLAIKYDYDTQCSMSDDVLSNYIRELDSKINTQPQGLGTLSFDYRNPYLNRINIDVIGSVIDREGTNVYYSYYGNNTIMYEKSGRVPGGFKFYPGGQLSIAQIIDQYPRANYYRLDDETAFRSYPILTPAPPPPPVSPADISGAFQPIGQYYSNLLDIKKRLNKFLEDASDEIGESQSYLANEERYDNRGHPEKSVTSKEIAYGLFSEVRPSTVPILMALGTFMASVSILMIFQMVGFTSQINVPPAIIAFQTWLATPGQVPAYQNPMILGGIITVLSVAVVLLGLMYLRSRQ